MRKYQILLEKERGSKAKTFFSPQSYYLCIENVFHQREYTPCKNIIQNKGFYTFTVEKQIKLVEIWNYEKKKKVGTVLLKRERETCLFIYSFQNFNLKLTIYSFNLPMKDEDGSLLQKHSIQTLQSEHEQERPSRTLEQNSIKS